MEAHNKFVLDLALNLKILSSICQYIYLFRLHQQIKQDHGKSSRYGGSYYHSQPAMKQDF